MTKNSDIFLFSKPINNSGMLNLDLTLELNNRRAAFS